MFDILQAIPTWYLVGLFLASMVAFVISTILGGGGALNRPGIVGDSTF